MVDECAPSSYTYRPLDPGRSEFRILMLRPGQPEEPLRGHFTHVFVPDRPHYETVSYCWGDASARDKIEIEGQFLDIPASSAAVLRALRAEEHTYCHLWIDALCINQADLQERGHQVALMKDLYSNGAGNNIFLGELDDETGEKAKSSIFALVEEMREETNDFHDLLEFFGTPYKRFSTTSSSATVNVDSLVEFFSSPWFSRLWVIQEAVLSQRHLCFFGKNIIGLTPVLRACVWINHKSFHFPLRLIRAPGVNIGFQLWEHITYDYTIFNDGRTTSGVTVVDVLVTGRKRLATEPRDYVFGLLGLMSCTSDTIPQELVPDYGKPLLDVCRDATAYAFWEAGFRAVAEDIWHRSSEEGEDGMWPSWVPKWHRQKDMAQDEVRLAAFFTAGGEDSRHPATRELMREQHSSGNGEAGVKAWRAKNEAGKCVRNLIMRENALSVQGMQIDVVAKVSSILKYGRTDDPRTWPRDVQDMVHAAKFSQIAGDRREAMIYTLIAGCSMYDQPATAVQLDQYEAWVQHLSDNHVADLSEFCNLSSDYERKVAAFQKAQKWALSNRCFFALSDGKLGLGSRVMRQGDIVAILFEQKWPVILRPWSDKFKFVGNCYVHGIMYGEALEEHRKAERPDQSFVIC